MYKSSSYKIFEYHSKNEFAFESSENCIFYSNSSENHKLEINQELYSPKMVEQHANSYAACFNIAAIYCCKNIVQPL